MAKKEETTGAAKLESRFNTFLLSHKKLLILVAVAIVVIVAGLWITLTVIDSRAESLQVAIDEAQKTYESWVFLEDKESEEAVDMLQGLTVDLNELADRNGKSYPVMKANYLLGLIAYEQESYEQARTQFLAVAQQGRGTYLGSLSQYNAGVTSEQLGDRQKALEYYQSVYDEYGNEAAESARALFSVARLHESAGNTDLAQAVLQQLADEFPASEYAKLAQSRLVILQ